MRSFSLIGLLLVVAIIGWMAKGMFAPAVSHDPNDKSTVEYWVTHDSDRTTMLQWCEHNPQQQDSTDCQLATAAQMRIDSGHGQQSTTSQSRGNNGVDQASSGANDQLQAQQDSNIIDSGGQ
jgi:hypothetical protein